MDQDAFSVLLSSQSQSAKRRRSTDQKDKYAACPICGTSIPKAFLPSHTEDCLGRSEKPSQLSQQRKVQKTDSTPTPTATAADASSLSPVKPQSSQPFGSPIKQSPTQQSPVKQPPSQEASAKRSPAKQSPAKRSPAAKQTAAGTRPNGSPRPFLSPKQRLPRDEFRAMVSSGWDRALVNIPEALEEPATVQQQQMPAPQQQQRSPPLQQLQQASPPQQQLQHMSAAEQLQHMSAAEQQQQSTSPEQQQQSTWPEQQQLQHISPPEQQQQHTSPEQQQQSTSPEQQLHQGTPPQQQQQSSPEQQQGTSPQQPLQQDQQQSTSVPSPSSPADPGKPCAPVDAGGAVDAFAVLKSAQSAQLPMHAELFLLGTPSGSWECHWRLAGAAWASEAVPEEPAWTATINNITLPQQQHAAPPLAAAAGSSSSNSSKRGSVKLRVDISTNIPSGFGTAVDWDNPLLPSNGLSFDAEGYHTQELLQDDAVEQLWSSQQQQEHDGEDMDVDEAHEAAAAAAVGAAAGSSTMRWQGGGPGVLISALQKCVRRGLAASATRIALELLKDPDGAVKLTRRLSIICLEDGLLHPQLPLVVWTMMALSRGYVVGGHLANALLSITQQMAAVGQRDFVPYDLPTAGPAAGVYSAPSTWHEVDAALGTSSQKSILVKSMLIRAAYGGMSGDRDMLLSYAGIWTARFSGYTLPPPPPVASPAAAAEQQPTAAAEPQPTAAAAADAGHDLPPPPPAAGAAAAHPQSTAAADLAGEQEDVAGGPAAGPGAPAQAAGAAGAAVAAAAAEASAEAEEEAAAEAAARESGAAAAVAAAGKRGASAQLQLQLQQEDVVEPQVYSETPAQEPVQQPATALQQVQPEQQEQEQEQLQQPQALQEQQEQQQSPLRPNSPQRGSPRQPQFDGLALGPSSSKGPSSSNLQHGSPPCDADQPGTALQGSPQHNSQQPGSPVSSAEQQGQQSQGADPGSLCAPQPVQQQVLLASSADVSPGSVVPVGPVGAAVSPQPLVDTIHADGVTHMDVVTQMDGPDSSQSPQAANRSPDATGRVGCRSSSGRALGGCSRRAPGGCSSVWLLYLQQQYSRLHSLEPTRVTAVGSLSREDIPLAAIDFHVAPSITHHLCDLPQLQEAARSMMAANTAAAAQLSVPGGFQELVNSAIWQFRSSKNTKSWLQTQYLQAAAAASAASGQQGQAALGTGHRAQLEAVAAAAVAAWSVPGQLEGTSSDSSRAGVGFVEAAVAAAAGGVDGRQVAGLDDTAAAAAGGIEDSRTRACLVGGDGATAAAGGASAVGVDSSSLQISAVPGSGADVLPAGAAERQGAEGAVGGGNVPAAVPLPGAGGVAKPAVVRGACFAGGSERGGGSDVPQLLQPGSGYSEGALRVLELELSSLAAFESEQRRRRVELVPLLRPLAPAADAWCSEYLRKRLY